MMNKGNNVSLTDFEFMCIIIASILGFSLLILPGFVVSDAHQDGWIGVFFASIYPLYIVLIGSIIIKKFPDTTIMDLSKKFLGTIFGNFLNIIFSLQFLYYVIMVTANGVQMLNTLAVWFTTPYKITLIFTILLIYGTSRGLKVLSKIAIFGFYAIMCIIIFAFITFKHGDLLNVQPIFGSGIGKIAKATINSSYSYANMELILIIHPYVKNKKKVVKLALLSIAIITAAYTWAVFSTIMFLGPDIVSKGIWPYFFMSESIKIPVINNLRFVIMIILPLVLYKTICTEYFMSTYIMKSITGIDSKNWCFYLAPIVFIISLLFKSEVHRLHYAKFLTPGVTIFNLFYVTLIALLVAIKKKKA